MEPPTPRPLPRLGGTVPGGRVERTASGFATTLPRRRIRRVAEPDPDIHTAAPGAAWEALRAGDLRLPRDVIHRVTCGFDGERGRWPVVVPCEVRGKVATPSS